MATQKWASKIRFTIFRATQFFGVRGGDTQAFNSDIYGIHTADPGKSRLGGDAKL